MATFAYPRVSTDQQDVDNQRHGILEYANSHQLSPISFVENPVSGRIGWRDRAVGKLLLETTSKDDVVLFAEVSRMGRSTLQVLKMLETSMDRGLTVHIAKPRMILDGSMQARITATVPGLAAEIERELISQRPIEALARRKVSGKPLGRLKGRKATSLKLDHNETEIRGYLAKGISKRSIAKLVECSPSTLYDWLARRNIWTLRQVA